MSLWDQIQYLSQQSKEKIFQRYQTNGIAIEVRQHLAIWIENNFVPSDLVPGTVEHDPKIRQLCADFVDELERIAQTVCNDPQFLQIKLKSASVFLHSMTPLDLYQKLKDCLNEELRLLQQEKSADAQVVKSENGYNSVPPEVAAMGFQVCTIANNRIEYATMIQTLQAVQTELHVLTKQRETAVQLLDQASTQNFQTNGMNPLLSLRMKLDKINVDIKKNICRLLEREERCVKYGEALGEDLKAITTKLIQEFLIKFKWSEWAQESPVCLDDVQKWYQEILETIMQVCHLLRQGLRESETLAAEYSLDRSIRQRAVNLINLLEKLYYDLMTDSMIVEEQPAQVIKKETKFNTSVRFLCGEKYLPQHTPPEVKAIIINEAQASTLFPSNDSSKVTNASCGKIINNKGCKYSDVSSSSRLIHQFRNVAISNVRRADKRNDSRAMQEKFCLIYFTQIQVGTQHQPYTVWCCSVPFVFIVHVNQKLEGWATIFWDNAFKDNNRVPFHVPEEVPWSKMSKALNKCFQKMTNTTWNLTETNLRYLGEKFFQNPDYSENFFISRKKFCEKEHSSTFCLWAWFYHCIELTNKHLRPFWEKGYIIGFINRCRAEEILMRVATPGTFLLRFSDSTLGGISITYVEGVNDGKDKQVMSLLPFTDNDLKMRSLADRLRDISSYHSVYHQGPSQPSSEDRITPKDIAFGKTKESSSVVRNGGSTIRLNYVPADIRMVISPNGSSLPADAFMPRRSSWEIAVSPAETEQTDILDHDEILALVLDLEDAQQLYGDFDDQSMDTNF